MKRISEVPVARLKFFRMCCIFVNERELSPLINKAIHALMRLNLSKKSKILKIMIVMRIQKQVFDCLMIPLLFNLYLKLLTLVFCFLHLFSDFHAFRIKTASLPMLSDTLLVVFSLKWTSQFFNYRNKISSFIGYLPDKNWTITGR